MIVACRLHTATNQTFCLIASCRWGVFDGDDCVALIDGQLNHVKKLTAHAQLNEQSVVLDLGCGFGTNAVFLARKFGCKVLGVRLHCT